MLPPAGLAPATLPNQRQRRSIAASKRFPKQLSLLLPVAFKGVPASPCAAHRGPGQQVRQTGLSCRLGRFGECTSGLGQERHSPFRFGPAQEQLGKQPELIAIAVDFVDPANPRFAQELAEQGQRTTTVVTYLNEDFDDAPTHFPLLKLNVRGGTGDAIAWSNVRPDGSPDTNTVHAGMPPTRGRKWILSQWLRNKPQAYNL